MKRTLSLLLTLVMCLSLCACGEDRTNVIEVGVLKLTLLDNNTYSVAASEKLYDSDDIHLVIPDEYNGKTVTSIGENAFRNCGNLTSIDIPDSITSIGDEAFWWCDGLTQITVSEGNPVYHSSGNCLIETESKALLYGCSASVIPADGSVTSIGDKAFYGCTALTSITIPDSVTSIGDEAFHHTGLTSITISNNVTSIGDGAFTACTGLTQITVSEGNSVYHSSGNCLIETESKTLLYACSASVIPTDGSVTSIGDGAFYGCDDLTSITIPDSVTSIGEEAFLSTGLTSIIIPDSVTSIGKWAFQGTNLTSITIPDSITSIDEGVFRWCYGLTSITIPESVTSIGDGAFTACTGLTQITVSEGNPVYHSSGNCLIETESKTLLYGCSTSVIPADGSVTSIGVAAFACTDLTSITIPDGVTSIGSEAFCLSTSLISITIPNSVTSIDENVFYGSTGLTDIHYTGTYEQWNAIEKDSEWIDATTEYTLHCTDGNYTK